MSSELKLRLLMEGKTHFFNNSYTESQTDEREKAIEEKGT